MGYVVHTLFKTFKEILSIRVIRLALFIGFAVSLVWGAIGYFYWSKIITFTSHIIPLVPISMLDTNGALMLEIFFWFLLILLTFAVVFAFVGNFLAGKTSKNKANIYALLIIALSAVFWTYIWWHNLAFIHSNLVKFTAWLPFKTLDEGLSVILGIYLIYTVVITTMILIVSILNGYFIKTILNDKIVKNKEIMTIKYTLRDMVIFLVMSLLVIPVLFIPVLNVLVQIALWSWLMKDTFVYDNLSLLSSGAVNKEQLHEHKKAFWSISIFTAFFNFVPIISFIGPFFGELAVYHYIEDQKAV